VVDKSLSPSLPTHSQFREVVAMMDASRAEIACASGAGASLSLSFVSVVACHDTNNLNSSKTPKWKVALDAFG
jgi:hypothetical protein